MREANGNRGRTEEAERRLTALVSAAVVAGESNSVLVIGPRGSGKTRLVRGLQHPWHAPS